MRKVLVAVFGACLLALCVGAQVARAESIAVCSPEGNDCTMAPGGSLEEAVRNAAPGSVIKLGNGVYEAINIRIDNNLTIRGTDPRLTILQPNALPCIDSPRVVTTTERVFEVIGMQLDVEDLTIRNGCAVSATGEAAGGGIWASGVVNLRRVIMQDNAAIVLTPKGPGSAKGGAIFNGGLMTIEDSTIITNTAKANDTGAFGGGLFNNGIATLINNTIGANRAIDPDGTGNMQYGGGIYSSGALLTLEYNSVIGNFATTDGGGLWSIGPVKLINNLFYANNSFGLVDCGAPVPTSQAIAPTQIVTPEPCPIDKPPGVKLTPITTDTIVPVYRPQSETITRSGSIDFGACAAGQVKVDQLGNPRGFGGKCDLGAIDAGMAFMPTVWSAPAKPDLKIRSVTIDPPPDQITAGTKVMITVVVENIGDLATQGTGFYIDLAINPKTTPPNKAGHTWMDFCKTTACEGVIWLSPPTVTENGGTFTFKTDLDNDKYIYRQSTKFDRYLPAGPVDIWVYADSYDETRSPTGLEDELDETNNQYHYPTFTVKPGRILPAEADQQLSAAGEQPAAAPVPPTNVP